MTGAIGPVQLVVAEDRSKAWLQVRSEAEESETPSVQAVLELIERANLPITDAVRSCVEQFVAALDGAARPAGPRAQQPVLIAEDRPAIDGEDGRFEWSPELAARFAKPGEDEQIDYFSRTEILTVPKDTVIGRLIPPTNGRPGTDIFGQVRKPRKPQGVAIQLGAGLRLASQDSDQVVTTTDGRVVVQGNRIRVDEVLTVPGDVDLRTGSLDSCVDIVVQGTVREKFKVRTTKSLSVDRVIEAAQVEVGGDLTVRGGIFGRQRCGRVRVGGNVVAKLINETDLKAGGNIRFIKEILNSRVYTPGHLTSEHGTIIGGQTFAREGIQVRVIGSDACVPTAVAVGVDVNVLRRLRQIERQVKELGKAADQIREAVKPLLANLKRLLPAQRERATELLSKADELDAQVEELQERARQLTVASTPRGKPGLLIREMAYPNTHITIGTREARLQRPLHGPVRIELRKVDDVTQMVVVNQRTASVTVLPSTEVDLDVPPRDDDLLMEDQHGTDTRGAACQSGTGA